MAPGDFDGPDLLRLLFDPKVDLAPDAPFRATMFAGVPFAFALNLNASAVDQQVQRTLGAAIRDIDSQCLLAARHGAEVGRRPVEANQSQQAFDEAGCLPQRHPEQYLHRETRLNSGVAIALLVATPACRHGIPAYLGVGPTSRDISAQCPAGQWIVSEPRCLSA